MTQILYYLDAYTDEVTPCAPTLEAWAEWLNKPNPEWRRDQPADDGATFKVSTLEVLGDIRVEHDGESWVATVPIPEGTEQFFLRHAEGSQGWDVDFSADTLEDAADTIDADDGPLFFACAKDGPNYIATYRADPPRLDLEPARRPPYAQYDLADFGDPANMQPDALRAEVAAWRALALRQVREDIKALTAARNGAVIAADVVAAPDRLRILIDQLTGIATGDDLEKCGLCDGVLAPGQACLREVTDGTVHAGCLGALLEGDEPGKPGDRYQLDVEGVVDERDEPVVGSDGILTAFALPQEFDLAALVATLNDAEQVLAGKPEGGAQ